MSRYSTFHHISVAAFFVAIAFIAAADVATAHPGHGAATADSGVLHYLTSPMHSGPPMAVVLMVVAGLKLLKTRNKES